MALPSAGQENEMILLIGIILMIMFALILERIEKAADTNRNNILGIMCSLLGILSLLLAVALCFAINSPTKTVTTYGATQHIKIAALNLGRTTDGAFFLSSGEIDQHAEYYYMEETPKGDQLQSTDADNGTYVKEIDNNDTPHLDITSIRESDEFTEPNIAFWFDPVAEIYHNINNSMFQNGNMYTFYVPKGSVDQNYTSRFAKHKPYGRQQIN